MGISIVDGQGSSPRAESWASCWLCLRQPAAGSPPEDPEPGSLPTNDGLGLEDHQSRFPTGPASPQQDPDKSIRRTKLGFVGLAFEDRDLVAEGQDLQGEFVLRAEPGKRIAPERRDHREHGPLA